MWNNEKLKVINFEMAEFNTENHNEISEAIKINKVMLGIPDDFDLIPVSVCITPKNRYLVTVLVEIHSAS